MKSKSSSRRNFLVAASLGTAGAVAAVATGTRERDAKAVPERGAKKGYHVSEHILKYYKTTQV